MIFIWILEIQSSITLNCLRSCYGVCKRLLRYLNNHLLQSLVNGDIWANAVEQAIGRVLNAFIVTDHKDALLLRRCAKDARYNNLQIYISDFSRPR